jgi:hypothetical protein
LFWVVFFKPKFLARETGRTRTLKETPEEEQRKRKTKKRKTQKQKKEKNGAR